jgi:hypothetical protein
VLALGIAILVLWAAIMVWGVTAWLRELLGK